VKYLTSMYVGSGVGSQPFHGGQCSNGEEVVKRSEAEGEPGWVDDLGSAHSTALRLPEPIQPPTASPRHRQRHTLQSTRGLGVNADAEPSVMPEVEALRAELTRLGG